MGSRRVPIVGLLVVALFVAGSAPAAATLPGVNGLIAYQGTGGGSFTVNVVTPDGGFQRQLTGDGASPAWSASGLGLAFVAQTPTAQREIFTMAADGTARHQLTDAGADPGFVAWSPDDAKLAYAAFSDSSYDLWVAKADGSSPTRVAGGPSFDYWPTWSPDGSKLAFVSDRDGDGEVYVVDADGSHLTNVTNRPATGDGKPDWSPDGSRILFISGGHDIEVMNADGSHVVRIGSGEEAHWSPDGTEIAFTNASASSQGGLDIFTMAADGDGVSPVTDDGGDKFMLSWQPLAPASVTHTTLSGPTATMVYGESARFTARVDAGGTVPTGTVQFGVNGVRDGAPLALDASGQAVYEPAFPLDVGAVVLGTYGGDARWGWSTAEAAPRIEPAATRTTLITSPNPVLTGAPLQLTVTVANTSTDIPPFGSIQFSIDGRPAGPPFDLDESGHAQASLRAELSPGEHRLSADYRDDTAAIADFVASRASVTQTVAAASTTTTPAAPQPTSPTAPPGPPALAGPATPPAAPPTGAPAPTAPATQFLARTRVTRTDLADFAARLTESLRRSGLRARGPLFTAKAAGTLSQKLYAITKTPRRTLIAAGRRHFAPGSSGRVRLSPTRTGTRLLKHIKTLRVQLTTSFAPTGGRPLTLTTRMKLTRRGKPRTRHTHTTATTTRAPSQLRSPARLGREMVADRVLMPGSSRLRRRRQPRRSQAEPRRAGRGGGVRANAR